MPPRARPSFALLAICFFGSGMTGLIYELLWTRRLQLTFGSTTLSITTVLAGFMAGLGLGSYIVGRRVDRSRLGGIRIYGYLELGIGLYALVSLPLLSLVESLYATLQTSLQLGQTGATLLKFVICFPVLAFPAGLMGGTLPAMVRGLLRSKAVLHNTVGRLYGINTAGAALGTVMSGMVLVEVLGLWRSMIVAAMVNLGIAALVLVKFRGAEETTEPSTASSPIALRAHLRSRPVFFSAVAVALTGMLSMLYEVVWARLLGLVLGSSTYAFTIVLGIFLVGIAVGALIYSRASRDRAPTPFGLTLLLVALALWVLISIAAIPLAPWVLLSLAQIPGVTFARVLGFEVLLALGTLLVPTLLLGAALPMSMGIISRSTGQVGRDVGGVYLVNTFGAIIGSVLAGFVLIPAIGTQNTLLVGLVVNLLLCLYGVWAFSSGPRRLLQLGLVLFVGAVAVSRPPWPQSVFDSGLGFRLRSAHVANTAQMVSALNRNPSRLLFRREGRNGTITVRQFPASVTLLYNGKPDASSTFDMRTQVVLGVIPPMAHQKPEDVAVVGWGSGVTAHMVRLFPGVKRLDVVEIEPAVVEASRFFHLVNGAVERCPKLTVIYDDVRSQFLTSERRYDVVISAPSNVWMVGVSGLFSTDFYRLVHRRLKPGGVFGQWFQLYRVDSRSVAMVFRTLSSAFRHVQLWITDPGNVVLLGSDRPIQITHERVAGVYRRSPSISGQMGAWGPGPRPGHFFGSFLFDGEGVSKLLKRFAHDDDGLMTDDRPTLEYRAIRGLYDAQHDHARALIRAKLSNNDVLPPGAGPGARPGEALAGLDQMLRSAAPLRRMLTSWSGRFKDDPDVRLIQAQAFLRDGFTNDAWKTARSLPASHAGEGALLEARVLLHHGDAKAAVEKLAAITAVVSNDRLAVRRLYQMRGALELGAFNDAFKHAEQLVKPGGMTLGLNTPTSTVYKEIHKLVERSKDFARGRRLLANADKRHGPYDRLVLLAWINDHLGRKRQAVHYINQLRAWDPIDQQFFNLCRQVFTGAESHETAVWCMERQRRLRAPPASPPLWP